MAIQEAEEAAAEIDTLLKAAVKGGSLERVSSIIEDDGEKFADRNVSHPATCIMSS